MKFFVVLATLLLLATPSRAASGPLNPFAGKTILSLDIQDDRGNPWPHPDQIEPFIGLRAGDAFSGEAVRNGISLLYLKGLFQDVRVEAFPQDGGIRLVYVLVPITIVETIVIHGAHALSASEISEALPNIEGKEFRPEKESDYKAEILLRYQQAGYYDALVSFRAEPLVEPHRVALHVDIDEGEPTVIGSIAFDGAEALGKKALLAVMKSRIGAPLKRDLLLDTDLEAIRKKYADAGYPAAKAGPVSMGFLEHRAFIRILVTEGPFVTVRFTGNSEFSDKDLKKMLLIWSEHDVSDNILDSSADKIRKLYWDHGYADATVEVKKIEGPGSLTLTFVCHEGPRIVVRDILLQGNTVFTEKDIKSTMALCESHWYSWLPGVCSPYFRRDFLDKDVDNLHDRYLEDGYLSTAITDTVIRSADGRRADVVINIVEGTQTRTGTVTFEGNREFTAKELLDLLSLKPGSPYVERLIDEDKYRILTAYSNKGYLYTRVDAEKTTRDGTVDVLYRISEDRPVTIGRIILRGNLRTKDRVIMRELLVKPGDTYDYGAILKSQQRIYHLGYIRLAKFDPLHPGEKEYVKDMLLTVDERPAGAMEFGFGYGDLDRLRGFVELSHRNLWGTARYTSVRYEQSDILKRAIFNYKEPWLFNHDIDGNFSLIWSDSERLNSDTREVYYKSRRTAASFGVEKTYERLKPSLTYLFENIVNYDVLQPAQLTPEDSGRVLVSSLTPALVWDLRDDVFNPHRGALYGIALKEALHELWSEADFSKLTVQAGWFLPVGSSVVALSARAGAAWPFHGTADVPIHERFYAGGSTTVRGYTQDSIGPSAPDVNGNLIPQGGDSMAIFNIELRLHSGEGLGFVLFTDAGNVWPRQEINVGELRESYGAGIRYSTPVGPLRLDYGQKVNRRPGESPGEFHFNIGNTF